MNEQPTRCVCVPNDAPPPLRGRGRPAELPDPATMSPGGFILIQHLGLLIEHSPHRNRAGILEHAVAEQATAVPSKDQLSKQLGRHAGRCYPDGPEWPVCHFLGFFGSAPERRPAVLAHLAELWRDARGAWPPGHAPGLAPLTTADRDELFWAMIRAAGDQLRALEQRHHERTTSLLDENRRLIRLADEREGVIQRLAADQMLYGPLRRQAPVPVIDAATGEVTEAYVPVQPTGSRYRWAELPPGARSSLPDEPRLLPGPQSSN